jgi:hypothetical protein
MVFMLAALNGSDRISPRSADLLRPLIRLCEPDQHWLTSQRGPPRGLGNSPDQTPRPTLNAFSAIEVLVPFNLGTKFVAIDQSVEKGSLVPLMS